jgi:hypothetical protein
VAPRAEMSVASDLMMAKAALLYADHAVLVSPVAHLLLTMCSAKDLDDSATLATFLPTFIKLKPDLAGKVPDIAAMALFLRLSRAQRRLLPRKIRLGMEYNVRGLRGSLQEVRENIRKLGEKAELPALEKALVSGLLSIHQFEPSNEQDTTVEQFTNELFRTIEHGESFPLFDEDVSSLVRSAIHTGIVASSSHAVDRAKQVQLAHYLFRRLPVFEGATIDEILDLRRELQRPLVRFRAAMIEFSSSIERASWDPDFVRDAERVLVQKVEPAILDIEEEIKGARYLGKFFDRATVEQVASGSLVAWLVNNLAASTTVAAVAGVAMAGGLTALRAARDTIQARTAAERNHLFFYYAAGKRLGAQ